LDCGHNPYIQVFADLITPNSTETIQRIRMYHSLLKKQSRNLLALQHTLGKGYNCILNDDCLNVVGSYLSGQSGTLTMQMNELKRLL
jgi:hypothetical protein